MDDVSRAIAAFERTQVAGDTPFDRYQFGGETGALTGAQQRGLALFIGKARCVSCHVIEQTQALFTDNRFHNIGGGFKRLRGEEAATAASFIQSKKEGANVDFTVLTTGNKSEPGRFAVTENQPRWGPSRPQRCAILRLRNTTARGVDGSGVDHFIKGTQYVCSCHFGTHVAGT